MISIDFLHLRSSVWQYLIYCLFMHGVSASGTYCLSGGQLAGAIFGSILGTVIVLVAILLVVLYLRGKWIKGCQTKCAQFDKLSDHIEIATVDSLHTKYNHSNETHQNGTLTKTRHDGEVADKVINYRMTPGSGKPNRSDQLNLCDQFSSEYRTKRRRSSLFGAWWSQRMSAKRNVSYSTESLTSVNEIIRTTLKSRDVNGLGFNICGNLRDGIFIRSLSNRGPAKESGHIHEGDRILSVSINFENIVFEDALTIISYASAYPITLELQKIKSTSIDRTQIDSINGSMCNYIKSIQNSTKTQSTPSRSGKAQFHPLFKSQSVENMNSTNLYSRIFDNIDTNLEISKARCLQYSPENTKNSMDLCTPNSKIKPTLCSLEVIEETPQFFVRSSVQQRRLNEDIDSRRSSISSLDTESISNYADHKNANTITVTAEINAVDCLDDDLYAGLSQEERLEILRLSYDDIDFSRNSRASNRVPAHNQSDQSDRSMIDHRSVINHRSIDSNSPDHTGEATVRLASHHDIAPIEDDSVSTGDSVGHSSLGSAPNDDTFPVHSVSNLRQASMISPSTSTSTDSSTRTSESDRVSSPDQSKRDSGLSTAEDEVEKAQYEKLLYFQRQLAKQHEELARLGIHLPMPIAVQESTSTNTNRHKNGTYIND